MAFAQKEDYVGLESVASGLLTLRSNGQNKSNSVLEIPGSDGSTLGDEIYGHIAAPTCEYAIVANGSFAANLGQVYGSIDTVAGNARPLALSRVHITTGAGQEPTVTADAVQIEPSAARTICTYGIDTMAISPARHALTFGAFTYTESTDLALQNAEFDATANIAPATVNGDPVAADATAGVETVTATFWASSETSTPAVSVASGWHITQDWNCTGADAQMFVWTATFTKYLSATQA